MTAPLTKADLAEIKRRCDAATPGPWGWYSEDQSMISLCGDNGRDLEQHVVSLTICESCQKGHDHWEWGHCYTADAQDAAFIAAARTDIPRLLAHIEALETALRQIGDFPYENVSPVSVGMRRIARAALGDDAL